MMTIARGRGTRMELLAVVILMMATSLQRRCAAVAVVVPLRVVVHEVLATGKGWP